MHRTVSVAALALLSFVGATACSDKASDGDGTVVAVDNSGAACVLSATEVAAGKVTFEVKNSGDEESEFYLYQSDGTSIVAEAEHIGPGLSKSMTIGNLKAGSYVSACKHEGEDQGIRADFVAK